MIKKLLYAINFSKALDYDTKGEYLKVIDVLLKQKKFIVKNESKYPDYYVLLGEAYARLSEFEMANKNFIKALAILEETNEFNNDEVNYLNKYIYKWLIYTSIGSKKHYFEKKHKFTTYDRSKVRKTFLINFSE